MQERGTNPKVDCHLFEQSNNLQISRPPSISYTIMTFHCKGLKGEASLKERRDTIGKSPA